MKRSLSCLMLVGSLAACGRGVSIDAPDGFAELGDGDRYDYRAANADGVVLAVRKKANEPAGDLAFWSGALDAHLRRKGYRATEATEIVSGDGVTGRQIRYERTRAGRSHLYWVTVFVTAEEVVTVEAGGDGSFFESEAAAVTEAIASLEVG